MDRRKGERRQGDRRNTSARRPSLMPSLTPGQENAQGHSPSVRAAEAYLRRERLPTGPRQMPVEDARESGAPMSRAQVSGPSFLGLADPAPGSGDYLLEDPPSGAWRAWAVLLLLVLLGVLGYLQWKTNWRAQPSSPPPAQSSPSDSQPQGKASPASDATGIPAASQQAASLHDPFFEVSKTRDKGKPAAASDKNAAEEKESPPDKGRGAAAGDDPPEKPKEQPAARPEHKPRSHLRNPAAERSTTEASATAESQSDAMVLMAQRYLYGQGVRRDCDQAMVYLRAANQKASAAARSQMGALYATGYCLPLDRVRAYQWFTSALNLEPSNPALQRERNNLWAQMSSDERQQAVK